MIAEHILITIGAALTGNLVLVHLTGMQLVLASSQTVSSALRLGVTSGMVLSCSLPILYATSNFILEPYGWTYLHLPIAVVTISLCTIGLAKWQGSGRLHFLGPQSSQALLVMSSTSVLAAPLLLLDQPLLLSQVFAYALGMSAGLVLALVLFAALMQRIDAARVPGPFRGAPVAFLTLGMLALAVSGLNGVV
ncbi:MAG: Rnf-Nqr domain containing protein [Pseudomonadota bacterium]